MNKLNTSPDSGEKHRFRVVKDTIGSIEIPIDCLWGAQTQRSIENFKIGTEKMPIKIIHAFAILKKASAITNAKLGLLEPEIAAEISITCDEILKGNLDNEFPLVVWQTGSGTQSNMNVNEVIANYVLRRGKVRAIHPNDDVNKGQSSNDTFPTAMHMACVMAIEQNLIPTIKILENTFEKLESHFQSIVKLGRTHLQDAVPLTLGQEISAWKYMLTHSRQMILSSVEFLSHIALGGTAVGTGINTHPQFAQMVAEEISTLTGRKFSSSVNKFHALSSKDALVNSHGAIKALAANLFKIANDIRLLASGPRAGIGELIIPANEAGSSIMPGKVNPTQCEALTMVALQVMGNDNVISMAASQGQFQLNVFMPVIAYNFLQSIRLLCDAITSFELHCARGIQPNLKRIQSNLNNSLMLVTVLNPRIGYEMGAKVAKLAYEQDISLKEACLQLKILEESEIDQLLNPHNMVFPNQKN